MKKKTFLEDNIQMKSTAQHRNLQNTQLPFGTDGDTLCTGSTGTSSKKGKVERGTYTERDPQTATAVP